MIDPERIAKLFHEAYERLAPQCGYETRPESAVPWDEVPDNNKRLMTAVCWEVFSGVCREVDELRRDKESYRQTANSTAARVADLEVQRDELRRENARLRHHLQTAVDRLEDMLMGDDGQAWDEAEKVMPRLRKALEESECTCTLHQRMAGDGCEVCNPERARDFLTDYTEEDFTESTEADKRHYTNRSSRKEHDEENDLDWDEDDELPG